MIKQRNRLPREAVDVPSLEVFMARMDGALGSLIQRKVYLRVSEEDNLLGPFQPKPLHDSDSMKSV